MLEGKALVIAIMMLTAAPIAATDSGQIFIGDVKDNFEDLLANDEPTKVSEIIDDSNIDEKDLLTTEDSDVPCFTFEEWKEQFLPEDKEVVREEKDGARNGDGKETDEKKDDSDEKENDLDKDWIDKDTVFVNPVTKDDCLSAEEWALKFESDRKEPCFTLEDLEKKMRDDRKDWQGNWEDDWDKERDNDNDNDDESEDETDEEESEQDEDDDTPCNGPNCDNDDESEDEEEASGDDDEVTIIHDDDESDEDESDEDQSDEDQSDEDQSDEDQSDEDQSDEDHDLNDEEKAELVAVIGELKEACEGGDEAACLELEELLEEYWKDWEQDKKRDWDRKEKDWDDKACLTKEEWKEIFGGGKDRKGGYDRDDDRKERGPHRDAFVREVLEELEYACEEEGDEEACAELEEMIAEFEEREGDCDKERDDEEDDSNEDDSNEDDSNEDDSNEDDSNEDESEE